MPSTCTEGPFSTLSSVSASAAAPTDYGLFLGDSLGEDSVYCTSKRALFHDIEDFWNWMFFILKQVP